MLHTRSLLAALLILAACSDDPEQPGTQPTDVAASDRALLLTHVSRLAHDSMVGRGSGTNDERRAAQYIERQFSGYGLDAVGLMNIVAGVSSQNVLGVLPGTGELRNQWVVLGAHYDHVGLRSTVDGPAIFNGADDNASGTSVLLELARLFSTHAQNDGFGTVARRSVLFVAFGAEELGLIGSEYFCAHPTIPLGSITAMLNFDMVGRLRNRTVGVGGRATALEWLPLLAAENTDQLVLAENDCPACTDHACFRRAGRPVLWFFTGFHDEYHQPSDDVNLINQEGLGQIADLAARITSGLLVRPSGLTPLPID